MGQDQQFVLATCPSCGDIRRVATRVWQAGNVACERCCCFQMRRLTRHYEPKKQPPMKVMRCKICMAVLLADERKEKRCKRCAQFLVLS